MGNLPNSRTVTANPSDSVSSSLIDELQDCIIGAKRKAWRRNFYPKFLVPGTFVGGIVTVATHNVLGYASPGGAVNPAIFDIPFEDGDRLIGLKYWAAGNGTVDLVGGTVFYGATMTVDPTNISGWTDNNRAAAFDIVDAFGAGTPQLLANGASLFVQLITNAAGYTIGPWQATFDRL